VCNTEGLSERLVGGGCCCIGILCSTSPKTQELYITPFQPLKKKQVLRTLESTHGSSFHALMSAPMGVPRWV
jgi:hypothetical protein